MRMSDGQRQPTTDKSMQSLRAIICGLACYLLVAVAALEKHQALAAEIVPAGQPVADKAVPNYCKDIAPIFRDIVWNAIARVRSRPLAWRLTSRPASAPPTSRTSSRLASCPPGRPCPTLDQLKRGQVAVRAPRSRPSRMGRRRCARGKPCRSPASTPVSGRLDSGDARPDPRHRRRLRSAGLRRRCVSLLRYPDRPAEGRLRLRHRVPAG